MIENKFCPPTRIHSGVVGSAAAALTAVALLAPAPAAAQIISFPETQWNKLNPTYTGKQRDQVTSFNRRAPNFERIATFSAKNRYRRLAAPIGRIEVMMVMPDGRRRVSFCTGTIISRKYIITNYHCIPGKRGRAVRAQIRFGYLTRQTWGKTYKLAITPVEGDSRLDYAVVAVEGDPSATYGHIKLHTGKVDAGEELFIIHHPLGKPKRLTRKDCRAATQNHLVDYRLRHVCDTEGGSSGSLIFSDISGRLVALHFAGGLSRARPGSANNAIRIDLVMKHSRILSALAAGKSVARVPPAPAATPGTPGTPATPAFRPDAPRPGTPGRPAAPGRTPGTSPGVTPPAAPPASTPGSTPGSIPGTPSGTPSGSANGAVDARLIQYLRGVWEGTLQNGRRSVIRFFRGGRFQIIDPERKLALVGAWRAEGGRVVLLSDKICRPARCRPFTAPRRSTFIFQRVDRNTFRTPTGTFRRRAG